MYEQVDGMSRAQTVKLNLENVSREKDALLIFLNAFIRDTNAEVAVQELAKLLQRISNMPDGLREEIKQSIDNRSRSPSSAQACLSPMSRINSTNESIASSFHSLESLEPGTTYLDDTSMTNDGDNRDVDSLSTRYSSTLKLETSPDALYATSSATSSLSPSSRRHSQALSPELLRNGNTSTTQQQR